MNSALFMYSYRAAGRVDQGKMRSSNQDRLILDHEHGFYGVSDGMGGLRFGGEASDYTASSLPSLLNICAKETAGTAPSEEAARQLAQMIGLLSDELYKTGNGSGRFDYGATLAGVWLYRDQAIFAGLGDSRGYLLRSGDTELTQVTQDMNVAGLMVRNGQMTREEAKDSPAASRLTAFVGMEEPATPETFILEIGSGDKMLLCSDGLYGMVPESEIVSILRSAKDEDEACEKLIEAANGYGGRDNISAVLVTVE